MQDLTERSVYREDHEQFREQARRFFEREIVPNHAEWERQGIVPKEVWRKAGREGLLNPMLPEPYGGGGDFGHAAVLLEEIARTGASGLGFPLHSDIVAPYIHAYGSKAQKDRWLPRMAAGELIGAIAMTEPGAGSDLQGVRTRAELRDGRYRINGSKTFITNGLLAGLILVVCKTDPAQGARGTSILIVETRDCAGFRVGRVLDKMGMKAQDTSELFFDDVTVPQDALLGGREGQGFYQLMGDLPYERLIIGLAALACMEGAYEATLAYVRERRAFGQAIADMQNTRFKLAEVATTLTVGRAFIDRCVEQLVAGTLDTATASMAKLWGSEAQGRVLDELVQLHGGYGYMNEYMVTRMYADARVQRIYGGTSEIMKEVIARVL